MAPSALQSPFGARIRRGDQLHDLELRHRGSIAIRHGRLRSVFTAQDMGRVEAVKAGIMTFLEASADVEPSLPRASWFGGPTDHYYLEVGMLVSGAL